MLEVVPSAAFQDAFAEMIAHEGGYVNHPRDPGGMTNLGVTRKTYASWKGVSWRDISEAEMRALTVKDVAPIYYSRYWEPVSGDKLPAGVGYMAFDFAVNSGPRRAIKTLQKSINKLSRINLAVDGAIGPKTLKAAHAVHGHDLIKEFGSRRFLFWAGLSTFATFRWGWIRRGTSVVAEARAMFDGTYRAGVNMREAA